MSPITVHSVNRARIAKVELAAAFSDVPITVKSMTYEEYLPVKEKFAERFPLRQIPVLENTETGLNLGESSAMCFYVAKQKKENPILGRNVDEEALVLQWAFFSDCQLVQLSSVPIYMQRGYRPYNAKDYENAVASLTEMLGRMNKHLESSTYLVGDHITLADLCCYDILKHCLTTEFAFLGKAHQNKMKSVMRWFRTIGNHPIVVKTLGEFPGVSSEVWKPTKPAHKEEKAPAPKQEKQEEATPAPKPAKRVNPLDSLPAPKMALDEWKRCYSNNDTRPDALDWFWKNFDNEGYSIWHVAYKYPEELPAMDFMCSNLVGGFFQRLESARKYAFGVLCVMKDAKSKPVIEGFFILRGQEVIFEVADCPDYESYQFTKVENIQDKPEEKAYFEDILAWEGKLKGMTFADGKVFK